MRTFKIAPSICLIVFCLCIISIPQHVSGSQLRLSFAEIAQSADLIFVGTAVSDSCWINEQRTMIFTDVYFENVSQVHSTPTSLQKNAVSIRLTFAGGSLEGHGVSVTGTPEFHMGHRYLIFAFDDGKIYANPILGGYQGLFEVVEDTQTGETHLLTVGGKAVVGFDAEGLKLSRDKVLEIRGGAIVGAESETSSIGPPTPGDPNSSTRARSAETAEGAPVRLDEFITYLKSEAITSPVDKRMLKREGQGLFYKGDGSKTELENVTLPDPYRIPGRDEVDQKEPLPQLLIPKAGDSFRVAPGGEASDITSGGALGACGYQNLTLTMEQVPSSWWSYDDNNNAMWTWNQFMDVYRYTDDDGSYGAANGENEFSGWLDNATLNSVYGFNWGSGIAMCVYWWSCTCCRITESDVMWNSAYNWTDDPNVSIGNWNVILLLPVAMHELGHTWGYQDGSYTETYDYDVLSVMHSYYHDIVENGWGIHRACSYLVRRHYDDQTSILGTRDIGVESYWASNGLHNSTTNATTYYRGNSITVNDVTVENMSYNALSDVRIRFFLSTNNIISTGDYQMGSYWYWSSFSAEAYNVGDYTTTIPSGIPAGQYYVGAIVSINGFGSDDFTYNNSTYLYNRITVLVPECSVSPTSLNFGTVCTGAYTDRTFTITNVGTGTLSGSVSESCSHYSIVSGGGSYSLGAGQTRTVTVRFQPTSGGTKNCTIETGNGICSDVGCTGVGDEPACQVNPTSLNFGTITVGSYADRTFTVTNTGGCTLSGTISEACSHYSVISGGGSYNLGAGQTRTVTVRFQPTSTGIKSCSIETGSGLCLDVSCEGEGAPPCFCGVKGDMNNTGDATPVDVQYLVNLVYKGLDARAFPAGWNCPYDLGDLDCSGGAPNPVDVMYLVNYVYKALDAICDGCTE